MNKKANFITVENCNIEVDRLRQYNADLIEAYNQITEQLQAKNAELAAEVERLKATPPNQRQDLHCVVPDISAECRELRQQLAIAEAQNVSLRDALENHSGNYKISKAECAVINDLLDKPASREALDAYVAEKVKEIESNNRDACLGLNDHFGAQIKQLTRQLDLAVSAATKARNAAQQCASVCSKHLDVYPALMNMIDVVDCALAAIKESEG